MARRGRGRRRRVRRLLKRALGVARKAARRYRASTRRYQMGLPAKVVVGAAVVAPPLLSAVNTLSHDSNIRPAVSTGDAYTPASRIQIGVKRWFNEVANAFGGDPPFSASENHVTKLGNVRVVSLAGNLTDKGWAWKVLAPAAYSAGTDRLLSWVTGGFRVLGRNLIGRQSK